MAEVAAAAAALLGAVASAELPAEERLRDLDGDGDGLVTLEEYMKGAEVRMDAAHVEESRRSEIALEYMDVYAMADIDGDKKLSAGEVDFAEVLVRTQDILDKFDGFQGNPPEKDQGTLAASTIIAGHDVNGDLGLDLVEYTRAVLSAMMRMPSYAALCDDPEVLKWIRDVFHRADLDHDRLLGAKEALFAALVSDEAMSNGIFVSKKLANQMFRELDTNGDGAIDEEEVAIGLKGETKASVPGMDLAILVGRGFRDADADGDGRLDMDEAVILAAGIVWKEDPQQEE